MGAQSNKSGFDYTVFNKVLFFSDIRSYVSAFCLLHTIFKIEVNK